MPKRSKYPVLEHARLYSVWKNMHARCDPRNSSRRDYKYYGGKGIRVCIEWKEFVPFADWAYSNGYRDGLTIDRIDGNKDYGPDNCRWITLAEQQRNKSNNRMYTLNGETHFLSEWSRICGVNFTTLSDRLKVGYSFEEAISRPVRNQRYTQHILYNGQYYTIGQLANTLGIKEYTVRKRLEKGWDLWNAFHAPLGTKKSDLTISADESEQIKLVSLSYGVGRIQIKKEE